MEYIDGDEYVLLDNPSLSFTPIPVPVEPGIGYPFEWNIDGWFFENTGGVILEPTGGFGGQYVRILDLLGAIATVSPPSEMCGVYSNLDNHNAEIMIDLKITDINAPFSLPEYLVEISGPGGVIKYPCPENISLAANQWHSFGIPIIESEWDVLTGEYSATLSYVTDIKFNLDFVEGANTGMDNVKISNAPPDAGFTIEDWMATNLSIEEFESLYGKLVDMSHSAPWGYNWDFGDGATSTEVNPEHLFMPGSHDVSLTVSNHFGVDTETKENYIIVYPGIGMNIHTTSRCTPPFGIIAGSLICIIRNFVA